MNKSVAVVTGASRKLPTRWSRLHSNASGESTLCMTVEEATKKFPEEAGISRYGKPEEIADLLAFMVSPAARWMTGASLRMDGGEIKGL